ncbi:ABC transporter permease [Chitinophaga lutea]|uniref:ABC transporter permease n=1 Tax=Chitinophaga lutea TaxID=2488634 RepID=A0A3N4PS43_9BACT|nr:FtsX-like permease family protein [Chitinophaga lutea]RPE09589.1 ABC transporter permease [Chitinophaga lutea]
MRVSLFIAGRIAFNRFSSFSKFIINIAMIATAFSVAVMIMATALINGFQQVISDKIFSFWGHMHVTQYQVNAGPLAEQIPFEADSALEARIRAIPQVKDVYEFATKSVIVKNNKETEGMIFKGIAPGSKLSFLEEGRPVRYTDSGYSSDIIISANTAALLQLRLNDAVVVYFMRGDGLPPRARKLNICGIYKTGIEEYDKAYLLGDISLIRRLNDWEPGDIGGYEVFLHNYGMIDSARSSIGEVLPDELNLRSMQEVYPNIFDWLGLQNKNEIIILVIMTIVAVINMITAILILILERTNMVGILKALGMRNGAIQGVFVYQAGYIVLAGIVIGNVLGIGLALLQQHTGFFKLPEESYYMSVAPIAIQWWKVILINAGTLLICVLILLIPSLLVQRILPVKAIQFK